jgi:threonine aldolase
MRSFASDNNSGIAPEILQAIIEANNNHATPYGNDPYTERAVELLKETFGKNIAAFFVNNGTAANVLSLNTITRSYNAIICADTAHLLAHEAGASANFIGCSFFTIPNTHGKISASDIEKKYLASINERHNNKPSVVSISQTTEFGTVYTIEELRAIADVCKKYQLFFHMDGCRLSNAAVSLKKSLKEITADVGVDVLSFGGTKNGLLFGESVIFFRKELAENFSYIQKQGLQLNSKMRFLSAQFIPYLEKNIWQRNATQANLMCHQLSERLLKRKDITLAHPVESNQLFAYFPKDVIEKTQTKFPYYILDDKTGLIRIVTNFDTTKKDIEEFVAGII